MSSIALDGFLSFKVTLRAKRYCVLRSNQLSFYPDPNGWVLSPVGARSEGTLEVVSVSHWDGRRVSSALFRSHDHAFKLRVRQQSASLHQPLDAHLLEASGTGAGHEGALPSFAPISGAQGQGGADQLVLDLHVVVDSADSRRRWMAALQHNCGHRVLSNAQVRELRLHRGLQGPLAAAVEADNAGAAEQPAAGGAVGSSGVLSLIRQPFNMLRAGPVSAPTGTAAIARDATLRVSARSATASSDDAVQQARSSSHAPRSISVSELVPGAGSHPGPSSRWFQLPRSLSRGENAGPLTAVDQQPLERRLSATEHDVAELEGSGHWHLNGNVVDIIDDFYTKQGATSRIAAPSRNGKYSRSHSEAIFDVPVGLGMKSGSSPMSASWEAASPPLGPQSPPLAVTQSAGSAFT